MDNLEIREDLLLMSSIPLVISDGKIGKIKINVHHEFALQIMIRFYNQDDLENSHLVTCTRS